ncbi:hypothetical protein Tco_0836998, partial [Tanacetum coccineum]
PTEYEVGKLAREFKGRDVISNSHRISLCYSKTMAEVLNTTSLSMVCEVFCKGEVNPTHAYYNGSRTSKDNEDPSWSTSFKTRRTQKTSSALEALWKTLFVLYCTEINIDNVGIKSLLEVTAAKVCVTAAKKNLVLFSNLNENYAK